MLKISRILRTVIELLKNKRHPFKTRLGLALTFLKLEMLYFFSSKKSIRNVTAKIAGFKVEGFNYASLLLLFKEIFIIEEYYSEINHSSPLILDCGANIGMATLFFKWRYKDCRIIAFEPDADTFRVLQRNMAQNKLTNVELHNTAISDHTGTITFYTDKGIPGSLKMSTIPERMSSNESTIPCIRLSPIILNEKPDILKIDVEGAEKFIFPDLDESGALHNKTEIFLEYHHNINGHPSEMGKFLSIFEKNGFNYQVTAQQTKFGGFQDILIHARK